MSDKLPAILQSYAAAKFKWGELDCCMFAADVVKEMTGHDYAWKFRNKYKSKFGAMRAIAEYGSLSGLVTVNVGPMRRPLEARRGDFVIADMPEGEAVGIADGDGAMFLAETGLVRVPLSVCKGCWHV